MITQQTYALLALNVYAASPKNRKRSIDYVLPPKP